MGLRQSLGGKPVSGSLPPLPDLTARSSTQPPYPWFGGYNTFTHYDCAVQRCRPCGVCVCVCVCVCACVCVCVCVNDLSHRCVPPPLSPSLVYLTLRAPKSGLSLLQILCDITLTCRANVCPATSSYRETFDLSTHTHKSSNSNSS